MKFRTLLSALLLAAGLVSAVGCGKSGNNAEENVGRQTANKRPSDVKGKMLKIFHARGVAAGNAIKAAGADGKVLVVFMNLNFGNKTNEGWDVTLKGMEEALGSRPVADGIDVENIEIEEGVTPAMVNAVLAKHADAKVIAFFGTLPEKFRDVNIGTARVFLFDSGCAEPSKLKKYIENGKIIGLMVVREDAPRISAPLEETDKEIFDKRYFIINKGNIAQYAEYFQY